MILISKYLKLFVVKVNNIFSGWKYLLLSMASIAIAMLCKEQGVTVAGICAAYEIFVAQKVSNSLLIKLC